MPTIHLTTFIHAPVERVFNLARSITLHEKSMEHTNEKAVGGVLSGVIQQGQTVTWQAKHLFKKRFLTMQITAMEPYAFFTDEMLKGDFKMMKHHHYFKAADDVTIMTDYFTFSSPYGFIGRFFESLFLKNYMTRLLQQRNEVIKDFAESHKWKTVLL